jgi:hypothetical protein
MWCDLSVFKGTEHMEILGDDFPMVPSLLVIIFFGQGLLGRRECSWEALTGIWRRRFDRKTVKL